MLLTPFPDFTGERLYVSGLPDVYQPLLSEIQRLEQSSPQTYYVVVIESAGGGPTAARDYLDRMHQAWLAQAREQDLSLDSQRGVIILLAVEDRQMAIHAGTLLQTQYGLRGQALDEQLVQPHFVPHARAGDHLGGLQALLKAIDQSIAAQDRAVQEQIQQQSIAAAERHHFMTRTVPAAGISTVVLLAVAIVAGLRWRHARLKRRVGERLKQFRMEVTRWMERLDSLKQRHQLLPFTDKDFTEPMTGQTLALYNEVEACYGQLRSVWLALMDRRTKADGVFELERPLGVTRLREVQALLDGREDTTQLGPQFERCVGLLDQLNQAHEEAQRLQGLAAQEHEALVRQMQTLTEAGLPPQMLQAQTARQHTLVQEAVAIVRADPVAARGMLESALGELRSLRTAAQRRLKCLDAWRAAEQHLDKTAELVIQQRAGGIKLVEEAANPDPPLADARRRLAEAWSALEQGKDAAAEKLVRDTDERAAEAENRIERHLADRAFSAEQLPRIGEELAGLQERRTRTQADERELQARFHPQSWQLVADNVPQAEACIAALSHLIDEATRAADPQAQEFCRAADRLRQAQAQRQKATALLQAISQSLQELEKARATATARQQSLHDSQRRVAAFFAQQARIVGADAQHLLAQGQAAVRQAEAGSQEPRPHWPRVLLALDQAGQQLSSALSRAEENVRQHQQLMVQLNQARSLAVSVDQLLRRHTADRPRANQRFQGAQRAMEDVARASGQPGAAWGVLLEQLTQAVTDLQQSQRWAEEDIRLADQAAAALRSAEAEFQRSRTYFSFGVSTELAAAQSQLRQASHSLQTQDYERAISLADSAERAARQAYQEAVRQAEERRRRQQDELRRRQMEQMAASTAAAAAADAAAGASSAAAASQQASIPSHTSSSSWSTGTSQSSW
jgi:uncharacterized membrane protein YgcG